MSKPRFSLKTLAGMLKMLRRPRFTLRTLLVAISATCVWLAVHANRIHKQDTAMRELEELVTNRLGLNIVIDTEPTSVSWLKRIIRPVEPCTFDRIVGVVLIEPNDTQQTSELARPLQQLPHLKRVTWLLGTESTDQVEELQAMLPTAEMRRDPPQRHTIRTPPSSVDTTAEFD